MNRNYSSFLKISDKKGQNPSTLVYNQASRLEVQYNNLSEYADTYDYKHKYNHCDVNFNYIYKYLMNGKKRVLGNAELAGTNVESGPDG